MTGTQHSSSVHTLFNGVLALVISMMSSPPGMAWNEGVVGHVIQVGCEILCSAILVKLLIIFWKIKDYFMSVTILKLYLFSQ